MVNLCRIMVKLPMWIPKQVWNDGHWSLRYYSALPDQEPGLLSSCLAGAVSAGGDLGRLESSRNLECFHFLGSGDDSIFFSIFWGSLPPSVLLDPCIS